MPNFNDMYLHHYKVSDYGLICKNNPTWGLFLVVPGPDAHLIPQTGLFSLMLRHWRNPVAMPPPPLTDDRIDYNNKGSGRRDKGGVGKRIMTSNESN
jgi:hypothetical protein